MAAARRRQRRDAPLARAPELARALVGGTSGVPLDLHARDDEPPGARVPGGAAAGTVIVPVGSTEDHGDHGPLWTDVYIPIEVAKRAAPELEALVGPPIPFGIAHDHRGAHGLVHVRMDTFVDLVRDVCLSLTDVGFTRIVLLNGHYCNSHALEFAVAQFHDELPEGARVYPFPYWAGMAPEEAEQYLSGTRRHPRERRRDLDRARHRRRALRHGASPRLHADAARAAHQRARAARPALPRHARIVLVAARGRRRRVGASRASRRPKRARSSSSGRHAPSSTSCVTWTTCTTNWSPATSARGGLAVPHADLGDRRIFYEEHGSGDPVLLVNGLGADHTAWALQTESLQESFRVVVFDNPGVGQTRRALRAVHDRALRRRRRLAARDTSRSSAPTSSGRRWAADRAADRGSPSGASSARSSSTARGGALTRTRLR